MRTASLAKTMSTNGAPIIAVWTAFIVLLAGFTLYLGHLDTIESARREARDYFNLNLYYRAWAAKMGGLYVPVEKAVPNPYLVTPRRDRTTTQGEKLTLINPAYMTRMVFEAINSSSASPVVSKLTSLKPLNPANVPDPWERDALLAFDLGLSESRTQVTTLHGKPYLRFISRFMTEESCLNCHAHQGYRLGDVRGAITISIPLKGYYATESKSRKHLAVGYLLLWSVGSAGIAFSSRRRSAYQDKLLDSEEKFRTICDWTQDWEYWIDPQGEMKYVSPSCLEHTGYSPEDFLDDPFLICRLVHPDDLQSYNAHLEREPAAEQLSSQSIEFRIVTRDGSLRWMHHHCRPVFSRGEYLGHRVSNRDVTDRKLAEQELAIRAELLNWVSDSVLVVDRSGRILDANETAWRSRGFTREELLSMTVPDLSTAEHASQVRERIDLIFEKGVAYLESEHRLKDGGTIHVEINSRIIDYRGEPAILSSIRDITRRKRTEESLRRSERFNVSLNRISQALLTSLNDRQMYHELLTTLLEVTESRLGLAGRFDESGALVCPAWACGECTDQMAQQSGCLIPRAGFGDGILRDCLQARQGGYSNTPCTTPQGCGIIERCLAVPLIYQGQTIGLLMVANAPRDYQDDDLHMLSAIGAQVAPVLQARREQQLALTALRENESKLRVIFDVIQAGIIQLDASGAVIFANQRMAEMFGLTMDQLIGSAYLAHISPEQTETARLGMRQVLDGEVESFHSERRYRRGDGSDFWGYISGRMLPGPDGRSPSLVATIADMTELKSAEEKRHKSEQQMLHVQKLESLGVLAGGIAHDFNNILLAIMGNVSLALHRVTPGSPVEPHLQQIELAAEKAADLARQMLAYSGKGRFVLEPLDLNLLVREMTAMLEVSITKKAALRFHLAQSLPSIVADPTQIRQIVMNLAINASEAVGERSGVISIATGSRYCERAYLDDTWLNDDLPEGLYVFIEVADNGCGMDRDTVARIFEPFFTTKFTGRGLGMAAIQGIVRGHKGAIKVYSEPGQGSSFRIYFPASDQSAISSVHAASEDRWRGEGTVLLVDDEETVRMVASDMLSELGFTVLTAVDGRDALQLYRLKRDEITLVLMDLNMPHLNGEEAFHQLRSIDPQVRVVLSSGFSEQEVTRKFLGKGLAGFVQKPYTLAILRDALSRLLRRDKTGSSS